MSPTSTNRPMPTTRPPIERIRWWDREMRAGSYPSLAKCCELFEISERTARRDLDFLRERLDAPCAYDRKRNGYYYTESGFSLPVVHLTEGEMLVFFVAETALKQYRGTPYAAQLRAAFDKLRKNLPEPVSLDLRSANSALSFDVGATRPVEEDVFTRLEQAILGRRRLLMRYYTLGRDEETERRVDPLRLHAARGDWYLIAYCHLRGEVREFALSRIRGLSDTGERFVPPADFDPEQWLSKPFGLFHGEEAQEVVLHFDPFIARWIRERTWHHTQRIAEESDGGLVLSLTVPLAADLLSWVLSYGSHCQVLAPEALREAVRQEARKMLGSP